MDRDLREAYEGMKGLPYWLLTLRYGVIEREAMIRWCDEALESLPAESGAR